MACSEIKLSKEGGNALFQAELLIKQEELPQEEQPWHNMTGAVFFGQMPAVKPNGQTRVGRIFFSTGNNWNRFPKQFL